MEIRELLVRVYIEFVLKHRFAVMLLCLGMSIAAGVVVSHGVFASSLIKLFFGNSPEYSRYRELADEFGESDVIIIAIEESENSPPLFTPKGWERLKGISAELESHPDIRRVASITNSKYLDSVDGQLVVKTYSNAVADGDLSLLEARKKIRGDHFLSTTLLSGTEDIPALVVELVPNDDRPVETLPAFMEGLFGIFYKHGLKREHLHVAGFVPETIEVTAQARYSMSRVFPVTAIILVCIVFVLFGQLWPVIATSGVGVIAILWTLAVAIYFDPEINLMLAMVPAVMMVVSFSDIVHLCSAYVLELKEGYSKNEAIVKSATEVGQACFFTSVTTFFGFMAIAFVPTPVFQQLGIVLGFGVTIALWLAMTLVPIFFSLVPTPEIEKEERFAGFRRWVNSIAFLCNSTAARWPKAIVIGFVLLGGTAIYGVTLIRVETNLQERLKPDNHIRKSQVFIKKHFAGTNLLDVYLTAEVPGELVQPSTLKSILNVQKRLETWPEIDATVSVANMIESIHGLLGPEESEELPDSSSLIAQYLLLFEMSGGEDLRILVDDERQVGRVTVRVPEAGLVKAAKLGDEISGIFEEELGAGVKVEMTGLSYLFGKWVDYIIEGQKRGLAFAFLATTILMILCLRLFVAGLVSMIPNALPLLVLGAVLGFSGEAVDSDLMMIGMIAIGIAVDDTIHFMTRLRLEALRAKDIDEALLLTSRFTGTAIVQTSVILCLGFLPFLMSDYLTTQMMGSLLPLTLIMALLADLLLLPALVKLGILRIPTGHGTSLTPKESLAGEVN